MIHFTLSRNSSIVSHLSISSKIALNSASYSCSIVSPSFLYPAQAGKRQCQHKRRQVQRDHPRVGGEKTNSDTDGFAYSGSPPRGRGKVHVLELHVVPSGITPAQAGKSSSMRAAVWSSWDHPRVGGEKMSGAISAEISLGSPPRRRGKATSFRIFVHSSRITPAWAGKILDSWPERLKTEDHPRVGGEKGAAG